MWHMGFIVGKMTVSGVIIGYSLYSNNSTGNATRNCFFSLFSAICRDGSLVLMYSPFMGSQRFTAFAKLGSISLPSSIRLSHHCHSSRQNRALVVCGHLFRPCHDRHVFQNDRGIRKIRSVRIWLSSLSYSCITHLTQIYTACFLRCTISC